MECSLSERELIWVDGEKGETVIQCRTGSVWVTRGDGADYIVRSGSCMKLSAGERCLVEALSASEIAIMNSREAGRTLCPAIRPAVCRSF